MSRNISHKQRNPRYSQLVYQCQYLSSKTSHDEDLVRRKMIEKIIRVDHAGELGATYIYQGRELSSLQSDSHWMTQARWRY